MLIGLYGGTFDPIHLGHQHAAAQAMTSLDLDELRFVLSARPGHREQPAASIEHRWQMLCLACADKPGFVPDRTEIDRSGSSFTYLTVKALRAKEQRAIPCWLLGQDSYATLNLWYEWRQLLEECNLVVVERPGAPVELPAEVAELEAVRGVGQLDRSTVGQIVRLTMPMRDVSASDIRRRIACSEPVEHLLADPVWSYIRRHRLYLENPV